VLEAVETALRAAFADREFGAPVHRSQVMAAAHQVAGVMAVDVDRLYTGSAPTLHDRLLAAPGEWLVLDDFDWLKVLV
jgi:hypothetical protein